MMQNHSLHPDTKRPDEDSGRDNDSLIMVC
jgi:hypothetical protein